MTFIACAGTTVYVARTDSPVIEKYSITVQDDGTTILSPPRKYTVTSLASRQKIEIKEIVHKPRNGLFNPLGIAARSTEPDILFVLSENSPIVYKLDFTLETPTAEAYLSMFLQVNKTLSEDKKHQYTGPPFITCMEDNTLRVFLNNVTYKLALSVRENKKYELITIPFQSYLHDKAFRFEMNEVSHMYNHGDQLYGLYKWVHQMAILIDKDDVTWTVIDAKSVFDMAINSKGEIFVIHHTRMPSSPMSQMNISQVFATLQPEHGSKLVTVYSENNVHSDALALFEHDGVTRFLIYTRNELRMVDRNSLGSFTATLERQIRAAEQTVQNQGIGPIEMMTAEDRQRRQTELEYALQELEQHQEELRLMLSSS